MIILGDIGNSVTKLFLVNSKDKILKKISLPSKLITNTILNRKFRILTKDFKNIEKIIFCSVVPKTFNSIKRFISKKTKIKCYEIKDLNLKSILSIKANYRQVGSDRLANAISLMKPKKNFIILDFGTATTFDVLVGNSYRGGVIAPGVSISLNTLIDKASLIPKINLKRIRKVIGLDTNSAVRSGFFWGYAGLIDNIINLIKKETRKSYKVVITGGFSDLFKNSIKTKVIENKNITVEGLIKISKLVK
ncbi:type III pantothenate kinase [Candidatus Pelagibacter sp.]|uniref:type III pantothenate kinase n=1 Tax=Candidatus Pelagibacter sp. TaxID=2024849 RepID=UPI003F8763C5